MRLFHVEQFGDARGFEADELLAKLSEGKDSLCAAREGNGFGPGDGGSGFLVQGGDLLVSREEGEPAVGSEEGDSGEEGAGGVVDGAKGDAVEWGGKGFGAGGVHLGGQGESADGFAEEGGFLILGLGESDG